MYGEGSQLKNYLCFDFKRNVYNEELVTNKRNADSENRLVAIGEGYTCLKEAALIRGVIE